jgi:TolB-like protein
MKKGLCLLMLLGSAVFCAAPGFAQNAAQATGTLGAAVTAAKSYTENLLPQGTRVLIAGFTAPTRDLAAYIADELSGRLVNGRRLTVVERSAEVMQSLSAETSYQLSGEVSDDSIQSIGYKTGAEVILTGSISGSGDQYRISVKLTGVKTGEVQGQWNTFIQTDTVLNALLTGSRPPAGVKPQWIDEPLSARPKYEPDYSPNSNTVSNWYYDMGISNKAASEQLARTRARQNIQQVTAENIASEMKSRIDTTSLSIFRNSGIEDAETRIEAALTNSIKTRVPRYETLEWYIETGKTDGKDWYLAYVLVRFPRGDIIDMVEKVEPAKTADTIIQQLKLPAPTSGARSELVREMEAVRDYALEGIRRMRTEH